MRISLKAALILAASAALGLGSADLRRAAAQGTASDPVAPIPAEADTTLLDGTIHSLRAGLRYGRSWSPLEDGGVGVGETSNERVTLFLESGIGERGFARLSIGRSWSDEDRDMPPWQLDSDGRSTRYGATLGAFVLPYLALGASGQYTREKATDSYASMLGGRDVAVGREESSWYVAPFAMVVAPLGSVDLTLLGAYARQKSRSEYDWTAFPWLNSVERGEIDLRIVDVGITHSLTDTIRVGGSLARNDVMHQKTQGADLPLDDHWYTLGSRMSWQATSAIDLGAGYSHDMGNARGNGHAWSIGIGYRF